MKPREVKHHTCPRCRKQAIVLVEVEDSAKFYRDDLGNIQYLCIHCGTTFSVDSNGNVITIKLGF
jgi:transposase-like protein